MTAIKELAENYIIQISGKALSIVFGLITIGILTRHLGASGFGEYTTAITYLSLFGVFVDLGLTLTLVQMICVPTADEERLVGNVFGLRIVSGVVIYLLAPITVFLFSYPHDVNLAVAAGTIGYLCTSTTSMLVGIFQKHLAMWRFVAGDLVNRALLLVLVAVFAWQGYGVIAVFFALTIANAASLFVTIKMASPFVRVRPRMEIAVWKDTLRRSWPMAMSIIFNLIYLRGGVFTLAHFRGLAEVGQYGVAYKVLDVLAAMPVMFMGLVLPKLTHAWTSGNKPEFRAYLQHAFDFFMILAFPLAVGAQVVGVALTSFIAGSGYEPAGAVLRVLIVAVLFVFASSLYSHTIVAIEKQHVIMWGFAATAIVAIVGNLVIVPTYGMWGAAWVSVGSEALIFLLAFAVVVHTTRALPKLTVAAKALAASVIMYAVLRVMPSMPVLIEVGIGAIVYGGALVGTGGVKLSDMRELFQRKKAEC